MYQTFSNNLGDPTNNISRNMTEETPPPSYEELFPSLQQTTTTITTGGQFPV